jgi:hypothetical protein
MKALTILGSTTLVVLLLASVDEASPSPSGTQAKKEKEQTKKEKGQSAPTIVHRSPAISGGAKQPVVQQPVVHQPVAKTPTPPVIQRTPAIVTTKTPAHIEAPRTPVVKTPAKENASAFVDRNINKFVGPTGKVPQHVVVQHPKIDVGGKGGSVVAGAFQKKLGGGPIKVGGRVVDGRRRDDLVAKYQQDHQQRIDRRFDRADLIRHDVGHRYDHLFAPHWWDNHREVRAGWWGRWPAFARAWYDFPLRQHWSWWRPVTWVTLTGWYAPTLWGPPLYYDYGGNVIFDNNVVYVDGSPIASQEDYAASALALAGSGAERLANAPPSPDRIDTDWMPLGVFGLANQSTGDPTMFVQLAVNKDCVIAGTYTNEVTNEALPVTGAIDPATQRAAWFIGDNRDTVFETGAYNLSQPETQVLVHFGLTSQQTWLMIRMPEPTE